MASKRRIRRSSCDRKRRFDGKAIAEEEALIRRKRRLGDYRAYHCQFCGGWHVGRAKSKMSLRKRKAIIEIFRIDP